MARLAEERDALIEDGRKARSVQANVDPRDESMTRTPVPPRQASVAAQIEQQSSFESEDGIRPLGRGKRPLLEEDSHGDEDYGENELLPRPVKLEPLLGAGSQPDESSSGDVSVEELLAQGDESTSLGPAVSEELSQGVSEADSPDDSTANSDAGNTSTEDVSEIPPVQITADRSSPVLSPSRHPIKPSAVVLPRLHTPGGQSHSDAFQDFFNDLPASSEIHGSVGQSSSPKASSAGTGKRRVSPSAPGNPARSKTPKRSERLTKSGTGKLQAKRKRGSGRNTGSSTSQSAHITIESSDPGSEADVHEGQNQVHGLQPLDLQRHNGSQIAQAPAGLLPEKATPPAPMDLLFSPPTLSPSTDRELARNAAARVGDSEDNCNPTNHDVTVAMFSRVVPTVHPAPGTLPPWSPDSFQDENQCNVQSFFLTMALAEVETWMESRIHLHTTIPRVTHADPDFLQTSWWQVWDPEELSHRVVQVIQLRYGVSLPDEVVDQFTYAKVLLDPLFAPWFAVNWRLGTFQRARASGEKPDDETCRKLQLPLEALTTWIIKEQWHNGILMADVYRASACNGPVSQALTQHPEILHRKPSFYRSKERELEQYIPSAHAMFRGQMVNGRFCHLAVEQQPLWVQYQPLPGKLGIGPPPAQGHLTGIERIPGHMPALDSFKPGGVSIAKDFPPPCGAPCPPSPEEDLEAMSKLALPAALYDPCPDINPSNSSSREQVVHSCGPGRATQWPPVLASTKFEAGPAGQIIFDVNDPAKLLAEGKVADYRVVDSLPPGAPRADMVAANFADIEAMAVGCDQGCKNHADLRYLTVDSNQTPRFQVFCCPNSYHLTADAARLHMDRCQTALDAGWVRNGYEVAHHLPPVRSTLCGHVLCRTCATVSVLTSPPFGACLICGLKVSTIKYTQDFLVKPGQNAVKVEPEVFTSGNLLAHHK